MQPIVDGIPNPLVSQSETKCVGPLFYPQIIIIGAEFILFSVEQEVCSQGRRILGKNLYIVNLSIRIPFSV